jgi:hypothetical protein
MIRSGIFGAAFFGVFEIVGFFLGGGGHEGLPGMEPIPPHYELMAKKAKQQLPQEAIWVVDPDVAPPPSEPEEFYRE